MSRRAPSPRTRPWDDPAGLVGVDEARDKILAAFAPLPAVAVPIVEALGLVLAEEIVAASPVPPFPNSAMDGYAVRASDTAGASVQGPLHLRVVGEAPAGYAPTRNVEPGTAVRIMTGAPVPDGADAVVRFEETDEGDRATAPDRRAGDTVAVRRTARPGENVRPAGEDVAAGDRVLAAGTAVRPAEIGVLAALGRDWVAVHRRPRVAILATGDEIVDAGSELGPGQIRNSNSPLVAALVRRCGGDPILLGVARDTTAELRAKLAEAKQADLIVTSGGVSRGDYDVVKDVLQTAGRVDVWQVRIRPGKPLAFGRIGGVPLIGLPGNPVAAAVAFEQFARPALRKLLGHRNLGIPIVQARLLDRIDNPGGRRHFVRVRVEADAPGGYVARVAGSQGAGVLTSLLLANGLLVVPEDLAVAEPGTVLPVQMLDWQVD
ncbi:MAG TPA: gephyrin-like molybdotransferase Glp [Thermomicrobiales bacterium]|jgi:molybdopterin molybdotransferase